MFLSRARLRHQRIGRRHLADSYANHQLVWNFFPGRPGDPRDFLFRVDGPEAPGDHTEIYILSPKRPEPLEPWTLDTKHFEPDLRPGDRLKFDLRASPTVKKDGRRHDVVMHRKVELEASGVPRDEWPSKTELIHETCTSWLRKKADASGFSFDPDRLIVSGHTSKSFWKARRGSQSKQPPIQITTCDFLGVLEVEDTEKFLDDLTSGFGPSKAFGMGLMLIRRA